jgi:riboflavin synthase
MFTGLIQAVGEIRAIEPRGVDTRLRVGSGKLPMGEVQLGDSIAVNGVCLTAVEFDSDSFVADVSAETLAHTTLGSFKPGRAVNLEMALLPTTRLGGHIVSGHVDGVGEIVERHPDGRSERFTIRAPKSLLKYIAPKGSICIDGTSLTVNSVDGDAFGVNIVPHTIQETIIGGYRAGTRINLEVDVIARYLERMLTAAGSDDAERGVDMALLARAGFLKPS